MQLTATSIAKSELGQFRAPDMYGDLPKTMEISYQDDVSHYEIHAQIQYLLGQLNDARIAAQGDPQSIQELDDAYNELSALKAHAVSSRQLAAITYHIRASTDEIKAHSIIHGNNYKKSLSATERTAILSGYATTNYMQSTSVVAGKIIDLSAFARQFGFVDQLPIMQKLQRLFESDAGVAGNPEIQALTATLAKIDNSVFAAQMKAKDAADMLANITSGLLRNFSDASTSVQTKMLKQFEDFNRSNMLSVDDKEAIGLIAKTLRDIGAGGLRSLMQAAREGKTFNDIGVLKQYLVIDIEKNETKLVTLLETPLSILPSQNPDGVLNHILKESRAVAAAARAAGISGSQTVPPANDNYPVMGIVVAKTASGRAMGPV